MNNQVDMDRDRNLRRLADEKFDLLVIGGGISGACLAYDAACRGLRVALVEKDDFGGATSSASSGLLHGGIRYLQQGRVDKVRESAFERVYFQNLAPHLCRYISFLVPTYRQLSKGRLALRAALLAYAVASAGQNRAARHAANSVPAAYLIGAEELRRTAPLLSDNLGITGAAVLPECLMENPERMTLALVRGAAAHGAAVANYVRAEGSAHADGSGRVTSVRDLASDTTFDISSRIVANCAGPWIGGVNDQLLGTARAPITGYSRGAHIIVRGVNVPCAVALPTTQQIAGLTDRGGRHMFLIPWRGYTLIGTSYAAHEKSLDGVAPLTTDMEQLVAGINDALGQPLVTEDKIVHAWAGIYPLTTDRVDAKVYQGTGDYSIIDHERTDGVPGYLSVFGAKFTTARLLAEKACDRIVRQLPGRYAACATRAGPVPVAAYGDFAGFCESLKEGSRGKLADTTVDAIARSHGADASTVLSMADGDPALARALCPEQTTIQAEVVFGARAEMVHHLADFVFRRSGLGTVGYPGDATLASCADILAEELNWSPERKARELEQTLAQFPIRAGAGAEPAYPA